MEVCEAYSDRAPVVVRVRKDALSEVRESLREADIAYEVGFQENCLRIREESIPEPSLL